MPSAYVINRVLNQSDRAKIEHTLRQCNFVPIHQIPPQLSVIDQASDVGIVCLPVDRSEQSSVDSKVEEFAAAGIRVIGIWLREAAEGMLGGIGVFGSSAISFDAENLKEVLDGETEWNTPTGEPRPTRDGPRNKC